MIDLLYHCLRLNSGTRKQLLSIMRGGGGVEGEVEKNENISSPLSQPKQFDGIKK